MLFSHFVQLLLILQTWVIMVGENLVSNTEDS